jgi:RNA polymerase sigma factor (TIGR02999 family)
MTPTSRADSENRQDLTQMLHAVQAGDARAAADLLPLVYEELRGLARRWMSSERPDHTLQATALVHEAYARRVGGQDIAWADRAHFFHAAAAAMRRILVDHARARAGPVRGGRRGRVPLDVVDVTDLATRDDPLAVLAMEEAIAKLEQQDPGAATVVRLRFYAGLNVDETARALGSSPRTVKRDWAFARAYLLRLLEGEREDDSGVGP